MILTTGGDAKDVAVNFSCFNHRGARGVTPKSGGTNRGT